MAVSGSTQEADGHATQTPRFQGDHALAVDLRLAIQAQHDRQAGAVNIRIQQPHARSPCRASATARFTAVVDLPTPPLPLATAIVKTHIR